MYDLILKSITINTIRLVPNNNQKMGVNKSFLILNRVIANTKKLIPINIQKTVSNVIFFYCSFMIMVINYFLYVKLLV